VHRLRFGSSCLRYYAYRKIIAVKHGFLLDFLRGENEFGGDADRSALQVFSTRKHRVIVIDALCSR